MGVMDAIHRTMTTPDTAGLCKRLRAALEGVTPGPWDDTMGRSGLRIIEGDSGCPVASYVSEKDAAFIALSREAAPVLLDTLERQAAEIERMRGVIADKRALYTTKRDRQAPLAVDTLNEWEKLDFALEVIDHLEAALTGEDHNNQ